MMSFRSSFALFVTVCCALSFTACHKSSRSSGSDDEVPSDDPSLEETTPQKPSYTFLLPDNVRSADFIIDGKDNFTLSLHLEDVRINGSDWSAIVTGSVTISSDELVGEFDDDAITTFTLTPCIIQRDGSTGITVRISNGEEEPQNKKDASLEISGMNINITDETDSGRVGNIMNIVTGFILYQTGIQEGDYDKLSLDGFIHGANVRLINYVLK